MRTMCLKNTLTGKNVSINKKKSRKAVEKLITKYHKLEISYCSEYQTCKHSSNICTSNITHKKP